MSEAATPSDTDPTSEDRHLFERLRERYEGVDEEIVRICDLVTHSESGSSKEDAN